MASDQTDDWIISLTLRLKGRNEKSRDDEDKKMGEIGPRLVIEMKEGTENSEL